MRLTKQAGLDPKKADCRLNREMPETPQIELADVVRLSEIAANTVVQYGRQDEVCRILIKMGFARAQKR